MNSDYISECDRCGTPVLGPDDTEGYCPDCAGEAISGHAARVVARQGEAQRDMEARHRIIQGKGGPLE